MGDIPAKNKMISAAFTSPLNNDNFATGEDIRFSVQITNLVAGTFTNPDNTYYAAPQQIDDSGAVIGHTHITVQFLADNESDVAENPTPPDPTVFAFFKGINDDGNGQGLLSADLVNGLPDGFYRVCSMTSASNHQPVLMPVAQRGAQDDCVRFTVGGDDGGNGGVNGGGNGGQGGNAGNADNAGNAGNADGVAATTAAAATTTAAAGGNGQGGRGGGRFGKGGQRFGRPRKFTAREFVA
jgi:hypothetical protein